MSGGQPKIFVTSDTHFFHTNIIKYCDRPWDSVDSMNAGLVENWNNVVGKDDTVYHLGDIAMGGKKRADELYEILNSLNGNIRVVKGNHDDYVLNTKCVERFDWVKDYYELKYHSSFHGKKKIIMSHYPFYTWNAAGRVNKKGEPTTIALHGHCHGGIDKKNLNTTRMDVGVDSNGYTPIWIENIVEIMNHRKYTPVDHHNSDTNL